VIRSEVGIDNPFIYANLHFRDADDWRNFLVCDQIGKVIKNENSVSLRNAFIVR
jgi:hypothetical protein